MVSPDELLDQLAQVRGRVARVGSAQAGELLAVQVEHVRKLLERSPESWRRLPYVRWALASTWRELQQEQEALAEYRVGDPGALRGRMGADPRYRAACKP